MISVTEFRQNGSLDGLQTDFEMSGDVCLLAESLRSVRWTGYYKVGLCKFVICGEGCLDTVAF